jgi:xylulokinase
MSHHPSLLAVDLGASFIKGAWIEPESGRMGPAIRRPFPAFVADRPPGWREVPVGRILDAVGAVLAELVEQAPEATGVLWCGQMHGFVLCDAQGRALGDFVSWQDQRSLQPGSEGGPTSYEELAGLVSAADLAELGREFSPRHPVATLHWLARRGRLPPGAFAAPLADFVIAHLCGQSPVTHPTNASAHGLYSLGAGGWHGPLIARIPLDRLRWPRIEAELRPIGSMVVNGRTLACFPAVGDQQAALAGARLAEGELSLNVATGSQVSCLVDASTAGDYQVRPGFGGRYLRTVTHLPAGRALNALLSLLDELPAGQDTPLRAPWDQIAAAVAAVPRTDLVANLAFFHSACGSEGSLEHLCEDNLTVGHLFRAAFNNMAENYAQAAARLGPMAGWSRVVFSGGLVQKLPPLREAILERLGLPHRMAPEAEDTLAGLRNLAGMAGVAG